MPMKLKVDGNNAAVIQDGKPVFVGDDGKDVVVDVPDLMTRMQALTDENITKRKENATLKKQYEPLNGISNLGEWVATANNAIATVQNLDDKKLIDAGKVEEIKKGLTASFTEQLAARDKTILEKDGLIRQLAISSQFASSPHFTGEKSTTILLPEIAESYFGKHFKVEVKDGKPVVVGMIGDTPILSKTNFGQPADFNEAMDIILAGFSQRDRILRAGGAGSGASGHSGAGGVLSNKEIEDLETQLAELKKAGKITEAIAVQNKIHVLREKLKTK